MGAEAEAFAGAGAGAAGAGEAGVGAVGEKMAGPAREAGVGWRCRVCGEWLTIVQRDRGLCDDPECRLGDIAFQEARRREWVTAEARTRAARSWPDAGSLPVVLIPGGTRELVRLPAARREAFARHLDSVLAQAEAEWTPLLPPREETDSPTNGLADADADLPVLARACVFCRGRCCETGGDKAWIEVATIQRILAGQDTPDVDGLRAAYLDRLPEMSHEGSCVFHGERGCTLPRELRSRVCNRFACTGLAALAANWKQPPRRCLVATDTSATRIALAEEDSIQQPD